MFRWTLAVSWLLICTQNPWWDWAQIYLVKIWDVIHIWAYWPAGGNISTIGSSRTMLILRSLRIQNHWFFFLSNLKWPQTYINGQKTYMCSSTAVTINWFWVHHVCNTKWNRKEQTPNAKASMIRYLACSTRGHLCYSSLFQYFQQHVCSVYDIVCLMVIRGTKTHKMHTTNRYDYRIPHDGKIPRKWFIQIAMCRKSITCL